MNVYIICWETVGSNYIGGIGRHILEISTYLINKGHSVHLITGYPPEGCSLPEGIDVVVARSFGFAGMKLISFGLFANRVLKTIKLPSDSIIHIHLPNGIGFPLFYKGNEKIPLLYTVHTSYYGFMRYVDKMHRGWIKRFVVRWYLHCMHTLERHVLSKADAVIAVSDSIKREIEQFCDVKLVRIYNGVDVSTFTPEYAVQDLINHYALTDSTVILLFVGRLEPQKGIEDILLSLRHLPDSVKLLVVGTGSMRQKIEKFIHKNVKGRVILAGRVSDANLVRFYALADIFAAPSLYEGNPLTVLEAMSSGLPIIASNIPEMREIVTDGVNGLLFEVQNPKDLAEKVNVLVQSKDLREKMGKSGRKNVADYSWDRVAVETEKVYKMVME